MTNSVFISYSHSDVEFADFIDSTLRSVGINTLRDVRDIRHMKNIKSFMQRISDCDYVILLISKRYLESYYSMYEVLELIRNRSFIDKTHIFALDDSKIFTEESRLDYIDYWTKVYNELHDKASKLELEEITSSTKKLKMIRTIRINIGEFLEELSYHKLYTKKSDITELISQIGMPDIKLYPELIEAVSENNFTKRGVLIDKFLIKNPDNVIALILKGEHEIDKGQFESAEQYLMAAIQKNSSAWTAYFKLGDVYFSLNQLTASEKYYKYAIEKNSAVPDIFANLAITQQKMGKLTDAEFNFKKCIELDPMNSKWYRNLGVFLDAELNKTTEAMDAYRLAIQLNESDYSSYNNLAILLNESGNKEEALKLLNQLIEKNPIHENGLYNLIDLKIILKDFNKIIQYINSYFLLNPFNSYSDVFYWFDQIPLKNIPIKERMEVITSMEELNNNNSDFYFTYGVYLETLNDFEQANMKYLLALQFEPDADMLVDYSMFLNEHYQDISPLFGSGRSVKILKNLRQALQIDPNNERALHMFATEYEKSPHVKYANDLREWLQTKES